MSKSKISWMYISSFHVDIFCKNCWNSIIPRESDRRFQWRPWSRIFFIDEGTKKSLSLCFGRLQRAELTLLLLQDRREEERGGRGRRYFTGVVTGGILLSGTLSQIDWPEQSGSSRCVCLTICCLRVTLLKPLIGWWRLPSAWLVASRYWLAVGTLRSCLQRGWRRGQSLPPHRAPPFRPSSQIKSNFSF